MYECSDIDLLIVRRMLAASTEDWVSASIRQINGVSVVFTGCVKNPDFPEEPDFLGGVDLFSLRESLEPGEFDLLIQKMDEFEVSN
jgi:hypothetical protein